MNVKQETKLINHWANNCNNEPPIGFCTHVKKSSFIIEFYNLHSFAIKASIYILSLLLLAVVVIVSVVFANDLLEEKRYSQNKSFNDLLITKNLSEKMKYSSDNSLTDSIERQLNKKLSKTLNNNELKSKVDKIESESFGFAEITEMSARVINHDEGSYQGKSDPFVKITLEYYINKKITKNVIIDQNMYDNNEPQFTHHCYTGYIPVNSSITFSIYDRDKDEDNPHFEDQLIGQQIRISILKDIVEQELSEKQFIADIYSGQFHQKADYYFKFNISWKKQSIGNHFKCYE